MEEKFVALGAGHQGTSARRSDERDWEGRRVAQRPLEMIGSRGETSSVGDRPRQGALEGIPAGHVSAEPASRVPLVGREFAVARLLDSLKGTFGGSGGVRVVTGEAGVGKTRLLEELVARASVYECYVLSGRAQEYDHGVAYASLRDVLASAPAFEFGETATADLARLFAALDAAALGQPDESVDGASLQPAYLLSTRFLHGLCSSRPTLVVLDDAHLADDETLTALSLAARRVETVPLLLVVSVRQHRWIPGSAFAETVGRLVDSGLGTVTALDPLDAEDTSALIASTMEARPDERLASYIYAQSRGNPLLVGEALHSLEESGAVRRERGRCYLVGNPGVGALSGRASLLHRVFQQDQSSRELARVMSAFRRVDAAQIGSLQRITGMDQDEVERAFDALVKASIVIRVPSGHFEFAHPLMAGVLYNDLGPLERRRLHGLIAASFGPDRLLEPGGVLEWTTHVAEAAVPGDDVAVSAVLRAASLTRNTAPLSAATWYQRALDLLPPEAPDRAELLASQAIAFWKGSRPEAAIEVGSRALTSLGRGPVRTRVLEVVINANYAMGRYAEALGVLNSDFCHVENPAPFRAQHALLLAHTGRTEEAAVLSSQVDAGTGTVGEQAVTYSYLGHVANCLGSFPALRRAVDRLVAIGGSTDDAGLAPSARLSAVESAAYLLAITGCLGEARRLLDEIVVRLPETGWQDVGSQNIYTRAKIQHLSGDWSSALETIRSEAASLEISGRNNLAWLRMIEAEILADQAQFNEAVELLQSPALPSECVLYSLLRQCRIARIAMAVGDEKKAESILLEQLTMARRVGLAEPQWQCLGALVDLLVLVNRRAEAAGYRDELRRLAMSCGSPITQMVADLADTALGDSAAGLKMIEVCEAEENRLFAAQAHLHLGSIPYDAERHLVRAFEMFTAMGAVYWTHRVSARAKQLGISLPRTRRTADRSSNQAVTLSQTEIELVGLLRQGLTNREIAAALHYSAKTIEVYLSRLYQKLGYHSRLEVVVAAERGELPGSCFGI